MNAPASHTATPADVLAGTARWCVVEGDCADVLRSLPGGGVDALVSDPPSGIAFMGAEWDRNKGGRAQWVAWLAGILSDARRATRDGGRAIVWSLPRTSHWTGCAVEDAGWSIETTIAHLFGTGWPKGKAQTKPAQETWWLARTGKSEALNVEACRVGASKRVPGGEPSQAPNQVYGAASLRTADELGRDPTVGRYPPNLLLSHAPGCVCEGTRRVAGGNDPRRADGTRAASPTFTGLAAHAATHTGYADPDGTELVEAWRCVEGCPVAELDAQSGDRPSTLTGRADPRTTHANPGKCDGRGYGGGVGGGVGQVYADTGTASRFFPQFPADDPDAPWSEALFRYVAKPSRAERNAGCEGMASSGAARFGHKRCAVCGRQEINVPGSACACESPQWERAEVVAPTGANGHPTVKSVALMRWLLRLVTKPGDVILDPFGGSGTTGVAALLEGRRVVLIEREPQYAAIARARCAAAEASLAPASQPPLFATG